MLKDRLCEGAIGRIQGKHGRDELPEGFGEGWRKGRKLGLDNLVDESGEVGPIECPSRGCHLVQNAAERPYIASLVVRQAATELCPTRTLRYIKIREVHNRRHRVVEQTW